ncbi:MAG: hypothetical protein IJX72_05780 [Clostridia bacterium]|nr:hypothetical protein [Clostridia bacterium]
MAKKQKKNPRNRGRKYDLNSWIVTAIGMAVAWVLGMLLPHRFTVLLCTVGFIAGTVTFIVTLRPGWKGKNTSQLSSWGISFGVMGSLLSFIGFLFTVNAYSFYKEPFLPFWEISLILGLAIGIFVTVKWVWKNTGVGGRIGSIALSTFLSFFLIWIFLCHLNYLLDFHPPVEKQAVIEKKDEDYNRKSPNTYSFQMTVDGETFYLDVDWMEYQLYEVGDTYTFEEHRGAFGKPFYIAED